MKKRNNALVFGGSGFLGSHLCDVLIKNKFNVTVFDIKRNKFQKKIKFIKGNITNRKKIYKLIKNYDYIFNFAGISDIANANISPLSTIYQNFLGTINILEALKFKKIKRFIFASSIYAISSQGGFYSATKRSCENIIEEYSKKYGINYTILRYGSLYGTRANKLNAIHNFISQALKTNKIIRKGNGQEIRNYINVKDAANITFHILNKKYNNKYLNIIGREKMKVKEVLNLIKKKLNVKEIIFLKKQKIKYHYLKNPYSYKLKIGKTISPKKSVKFNEGLKDIADEIRKTL